MSIKVGDKVEFVDEFGKKQVNIVTAIGEAGRGLLSIRGTYGWYVRKPEEVRKAEASK